MAPASQGCCETQATYSMRTRSLAQAQHVGNSQYPSSMGVEKALMKPEPDLNGKTWI